MYRIQLVEKCSLAEKNVSIRVVVFEKRFRTAAGPAGRAQTVRGAGEVDAMPVRCVVPLHQMRIAGACPSHPGHTRDIMALCGARNAHAHPA